MLLKLDQIRLDGGTQPRAVLSQDVINEYADLMRSGVLFPPVTVFFDGSDYWLADGFHRIGAARQISSSGNIEVEVHQGTRRDAVLCSVGANAAHGLPRTNEDKRRAVLALLNDTEWGSWPVPKVAEACHVSERYVFKLKQEHPHLLHNAVDSKTVTRGGTTYRQNTAKIGKSPGAKRRRKCGGVSPKAAPPVRGHSKPAPKTALELPHDPEWAARTLISVFDRPFLESLVAAITRHLQGENT